jgi:hypothetical protein
LLNAFAFALGTSGAAQLAHVTGAPTGGLTGRSIVIVMA